MDGIRCSKCRRDLWRISECSLTTAHGVQLEKSETTTDISECASERWQNGQVYSDGENVPEWAQKAIEEGGYLSGRLRCTCGAPVGRFDFVSGRHCACEKTQLPPIQLDPKKVDFVKHK